MKFIEGDKVILREDYKDNHVPLLEPLFGRVLEVARVANNFDMLRLKDPSRIGYLHTERFSRVVPPNKFAEDYL